MSKVKTLRYRCVFLKINTVLERLKNKAVIENNEANHRRIQKRGVSERTF